MFQKDWGFDVKLSSSSLFLICFLIWFLNERRLCKRPVALTSGREQRSFIAGQKSFRASKSKNKYDGRVMIRNVTPHPHLNLHRRIKRLTCCEWRCNGLGSNFPLYCDEANGVRSGRQQPLDQGPCLGAIQRHLRGVGTIWGAVAQDEEVSWWCRGAPGHQHRVESHLWQVEVSYGSDSWRNNSWSSSAVRKCWSQAGNKQLGWMRSLDEDGWQARSQWAAEW